MQRIPSEPLVSIAAALAITFAASGTAQDKKPAAKEPTLAQAVVVEVYEHDLGKAMAMYRAIAADEDRPAAARTQARLRLGLAYRRLGETAQAEASLRLAASGSGPAAQEAAAILTGTVQDDGDLVKAKVQQALRAMRLTGRADKSDLAWIGQPAVPYIVKAVDAEKADLRFITNASDVLFRLGGDEVLAWIDRTRASGDVLRKRAVIKGFYAGSSAVNERLATMFADAEASVRRELLARSIPSSAATMIEAYANDPDEGVRQAAFGRLAERWTDLDHGGDPFASFRALIAVLEAKKPGRSVNSGSSLGMWLAALRNGRWEARSPLPATDEACRTILRAAVLPCFAGVPILWPRDAGDSERNAFVQEIAAAARAVGKVDPDAQYMTGAGTVGLTARRNTLSIALPRLLPSWDHAAMDVVLRMIRLGYDHNEVSVDWVVKHATAADVPAVIGILAESRSTFSQLCDWLEDTGVRDAHLPALTALADTLRGPGGKQVDRRVTDLLTVIFSIGSEDAVSYLADTIAADWNRLSHFLNEGQNQGQGTATHKAILRRLLVMPGTGTERFALRARAFDDLLRRHDDPGPAAAFAEAYRLGLGVLPLLGSGDYRARYVRGTLRGIALAFEWTRQVGAESRARIIDACLATGEVEAFKDLHAGLHHPSARSPLLSAIRDAFVPYAVRVPDLPGADGTDLRPILIRKILERASGEVGKAATLAALRSKDEVLRAAAAQSLRTEYAGPEFNEVVVGLIEAQDPKLRRAAVSFLAQVVEENPRVRRVMEGLLRAEDQELFLTAVRYFAEHDPKRLRADPQGLLRHAERQTRSLVATRLLHLFGGEVIGAVGPVLTDTEVHVSYRVALIGEIGQLMDPRAVPFLLEAMKNLHLRAAAQEQLSAIRLYHEERSRWRELMAGGLDEPSAAAALVAQAKAGRADIRRAAIASLGTLGDPETLPFLVKLMSDADGSIAAAAKAAVDRINMTAARRDKDKQE